LLQAGLLECDAATRAWNQWQALRPEAAVPVGERRLLPLVYGNLTRPGSPSPVEGLARLQAAYARAKLRTERQLYGLVRPLRALNEAGVLTCLLKGAALGLGCYGDSGLRPLADVDLLVPTESASEAVRVLDSLGYVPRTTLPADATKAAHANAFCGPGDSQIDLHWHVLWDRRGVGDDEAFWAASVKSSVRGVATRVLCRTDQLLHALAHGCRWSSVRPTRWVADAHILISGSAEAIDWARLVAQGRALRLTLPLSDALRYLHARFGAEVPAWVLGELKDAPTTWLERREREALLSPPWERGPLRLLGLHGTEWRRLRRAGAVPRGWPGVRAFMVRTWGEQRLTRLALRAVVQWPHRTWRSAVAWSRSLAERLS
jgi:hypothetical protein